VAGRHCRKSDKQRIADPITAPPISGANAELVDLIFAREVWL